LDDDVELRRETDRTIVFDFGEVDIPVRIVRCSPLSRQNFGWYKL
jgi:hypothetical protein